ncbi:MAG TPA: RidA family protein, partial [Anaerolineae bacterium]
GVAPLDASSRLIGKGDVVAQAGQVFENLKKVLAAAGADFGDILKVTIFLTDVRDRAKVNPVRQQYFGEARPASTLIGVKELAIPDMKIEIEAVVGLP